MIIVLEGPDLAGKTTLAHELVSYGFTYHHSGPLKGSAEEAYLDPLDDMETGRHVLDRWHVGELFYGPLLRGESALSDSLLERVEDRLTALHAVRFVVTAELDVLRERYAQRGDDLVSFEQIAQAHAFYDEWASRNERWFRVSA